MGKIVFLGGRLVPRSEASVPIGDATFHHGYGVFETMRARGERVFRLGDHLARLRRSAGVLGWEIPWSVEELTEAIVGTLGANGFPESRLRLQAGPGPMESDGPGGPPVLLVEALSFPTQPPQLRENGVGVSIAPERRSRSAILHRAKSCSYAENLRLRRLARAGGWFESIVLNQDGEVCEAAMANLFALHDGILCTPPLESGVLDGITRQVVLEIARNQTAVPVKVEPLPADLLADCDEIFLTSTGIEVLPVVRLEDRAIGDGRPGPRTRSLAGDYRRVLEQEIGPTRR